MTNIYHYGQETGEYIGASAASFTPSGMPMIPAFATTTAPPETEAGFARCFINGAWTQVEDHRGETRYSIPDGSEVTIDKLGSLAEVVPDTTDTPPPTAPEGQKVVWTGDAWSFEDLPPPESVTMRQARLALLDAGLLSAVDAAIAGMEGTAGEAAQIEWEYAAEIRRDNPLFSQLAAALGLSEEQLDDLFRQAVQL